MAWLCAGLLSTIAVAAEPAAEPIPETAWRQKIDPWVTQRLASEAKAEFLVVLDAQADLSGAEALTSKQAKGRYVFKQLRQTAAASQPGVLTELRRLGAEHRSFYIHNMIWVRGDEQTAELLARRADVSGVRANPRVALDDLGVVTKAEQRAAAQTQLGGCPTTVSTSVEHTGAPDLWAQGITGEGVVVAGHDTGYQWDHAALRAAYRGTDGASVSHDYNWHDAIHSGGGVCGANSPFPCDDHSHGTHTLGTMVGDNGHQITGMAPDAKWIGCRNMDQGNGTPASYTECFEFFLAPTDLAGQNPNPDLAPDVINNSWACPGFEGCIDPNVMKAVVENLRTAEIGRAHV